MEFKYNKIYEDFLTEYNLPNDFSFDVTLLENSIKVLESNILETDLGITVSDLNILTSFPRYDWETQSMMEDWENHFHVDWNQFKSEKESFMHWSKTLYLLALKFKDEWYTGMRFWYQFQTPKQSIDWEKANNLYVPWDDYCISDRLSFYRIRTNDSITERHNDMLLLNDTYAWFLFIDI